MPFVSTRQFRLWDYSVSHNQMLLRSPRSPEVPTNIDVVFWGVQYLEMPTMLDGIEMGEATSDESEAMERFAGKNFKTSDVHWIVSRHERFLVVASGFKVLENDLDIFDSSLEYFAGTDSNRNLGKVLSHS